jgi:hypothetical protein
MIREEAFYRKQYSIRPKFPDKPKFQPIIDSLPCGYELLKTAIGIYSK